VRAVIGRGLVLVLALAAVVAGVEALSAGGQRDLRPRGIPAGVSDSPISPPLKPGFVGLSIEYDGLLGYTGRDATAVNPVFEQLIRNLNPGQAPELRIGGDSTDRSWWRAPGLVRPGGIKYTLTDRWMAVMSALTRDLGARLTLGLNWDSGQVALAAAEARALVSHLGLSNIVALELGNEPELYGTFPYFHDHSGVAIKTRPNSYGPADYVSEFRAVDAAIPNLPMAAPATGGDNWMAYLPKFVTELPHLALLTVHHYATRGCFVKPSSPDYHTIPNLLSDHGTKGVADFVRPYTRLAVPLRLDEVNSVNCGGVRGISDTFASALWALDALFNVASTGISGVDFHTFPGARYAPFTFRRSGGRWMGAARPLYYGMLMFSQAAPPGSELLKGSGRLADGLDMWATRGSDHRLRVALINYNPAKSRTVALRLPSAAGPGTLERLSAPALVAKRQVTLGGQAIDSATGRLAGRPRTSTIANDDGLFPIRVPAASAALVTFPAR
jgi:hypothetical protein